MDGQAEFTEAQRVRAQQVLGYVMDEMCDSFTLDGMFGPHADILRIVLGDARITEALRAAAIESGQAAG